MKTVSNNWIKYEWKDMKRSHENAWKWEQWKFSASSQEKQEENFKNQNKFIGESMFSLLKNSENSIEFNLRQQKKNKQHIPWKIFENIINK